MRARLVESEDFYKDTGFSEEEIKNLKSSENPSKMKLSEIESYVEAIETTTVSYLDGEFGEFGDDLDDLPRDEEEAYYIGMQEVAQRILKIISK